MTNEELAAEMTAARAAADRQLAHVNATVDTFIKLTKEELSDRGHDTTDAWTIMGMKIQRGMRDSENATTFAAEMLSAALVRLAQQDGGDRG